MQNEINDTRIEYIKRINLVLDLVEKNLDTDLSLEKLSKKAFYSSFHFHRIFSAIVGETLNSYINRKKIERIASIILIEPNKPISELAYKYGFNSDSSFSRAFKSYYGISPSEFKTKGHDIISKISIEPITLEKYLCSIDNIKNWLAMNAQIEVKELQRVKLIGIMQIGEMDRIHQNYERLFKWAETNNLLNNPNLKAATIYHDNPRITESSKVRQSACITIEKEIKVEGDIRKLEIEKGFYAIGHFEISPKDFKNAWDSMIVWVIENNYKFKDGDYFELFHNDYRTHPEQKFIVDICIPVENDGKKRPDKKQYSINCENNNLSSIGLKSLNDYMRIYKEQIDVGYIPKAYKGLMNFIMDLRNHFDKKYSDDFIVGNISKGYMDYTYFPIVPKSIKQLKVKFAIVFIHHEMRFGISLGGQNRQIQKQYWKIFKESDWNDYQIPSTLDENFTIVYDVLVENPDFNDLFNLTKQIESKSMKFIEDITEILDYK